eukprot:CAMPEP_0202862814 /NCGR_PEP_ID=MMETSP1391-20130828/3713_1 /ASSEMBLY_ACC=CAM_ASM_000867 /TAXON_ID=1034604 /ORGANISM="Chlamydomonas leiostraca, Strain SAG 11-49" /LENGTH=149 /DNA_ID=CAMNT_0049542391 /DNA_START=956 /DNA_END=1403 /DNA_ORIENTATION=+
MQLMISFLDAYSIGLTLWCLPAPSSALPRASSRGSIHPSELSKHQHRQLRVRQAVAEKVGDVLRQAPPQQVVQLGAHRAEQQVDGHAVGAGRQRQQAPRQRKHVLAQGTHHLQHLREAGRLHKLVALLAHLRAPLPLLHHRQVVHGVVQ